MAQSKKTAQTEQKFCKEELVLADRLKKRRDLAEALLEQDEEYTLQEAEDIINQFMKGKVN